MKPCKVENLNNKYMVNKDGLCNFVVHSGRSFVFPNVIIFSNQIFLKEKEYLQS